MDQKEALMFLALTENASQSDIEQALIKKRSDLEQKKSSAPTESLAKKF